MSLEPVPFDAALVELTRQDSLLELVDRALMELGDRVGELAGFPGPQTVIILRLEELRRNIATVTDAVYRLLEAELPRNGSRRARLVIDGVAVVEPSHKGGGWGDIDYKRMIGDALTVAWDRGDIDHYRDAGEVVAAICTFSGIRCNVKEGTGLAAYGLDREDYATRKDSEPWVRIVQ